MKLARLLGNVTASALLLALSANALADLPWSDSKQVVVVTTPNWNAVRGTLSGYERKDGEWRRVIAPSPVMLGRAGSAWGLGLHDSPASTKQEGDGRSPAGVFRISEAFGYDQTAATALPYRAMSESDYCIDVSHSPYYNRIVDARVVGAKGVAGSTEPMRRDLHANGDVRYRLGFVIEHNAEGAPQRGSCIFAHLWRRPDETTAGCTAMHESLMHALLSWLRPDRRPIFVLLPASEYEARESSWGLPPL